MAVALVTGGAKRIGREICLFLAEHGYDILLHYHTSHSEAAALKAQIEGFGVSCDICSANFLNEQEVENLFSKNTFDVLINNASVFLNDEPFSVSYMELDKHFRVNVYAPMILSKRMFSCLSRIGSQGCIINLLDYSVSCLPQNFTSYTLSKRSLWDFTQLAALSYAPYIRANAIAFGHAMRAETQAQEHFKHSILSSPLQAAPSSAEIRAALSLLLNSQSITSQILFLDGGMRLAKLRPL